MTLKTPRQRRVMRKAIKMANAGQLRFAYARFFRACAEVQKARECPRAFGIAFNRSTDAIELVAAIELVLNARCV